MGLESTSLISGLNEAWPTGTDPRSEGDDHIRTVKTALKTAFADTSTTLTLNKPTTVVGKLVTTASTTGVAGLNVPPGAKPTSPNDGDIWAKTDGFYGHVNGVDYGPFGGSDTAAQILTKLLTVDGAGSNLDADLLDAQTGSYYLNRAAHTGTQGQSTIVNLTTDLALLTSTTGTHTTNIVALQGTDTFLQSQIDTIETTYAPLDSPSFTGSPQAPTPTWPGTAHDIATVAFVESSTEGKEDFVSPGTTSQYWRGDKTWQTLPTGGVSDAPSDGFAYIRRDAGWEVTTAHSNYTFVDSGAEPSAGEVTLNEVGINQELATEIMIHFTDVTGNDIWRVLSASLRTGRQVFVQNKDTPHRWFSFLLTSDMTSHTTYGSWSIEYYAMGGDNLIAEPVLVQINALGGLPDAPQDGLIYGRQYSGWTEIGTGVAGVEEAPNDEYLYSRRNESWDKVPAILNGEYPPDSGTGQMGDYYVDTANQILYGPKPYSVLTTEYLEESATDSGSPATMYAQSVYYGDVCKIVGARFYIQSNGTPDGNAKIYLFNKTTPAIIIDQIDYSVNGTGWFEAYFPGTNMVAYGQYMVWIVSIWIEDSDNVLGLAIPTTNPSGSIIETSEGYSGTVEDECPLTVMADSGVPLISPIIEYGAPAVWPTFGLPPDDGEAYGRLGDGSWQVVGGGGMPTDFTYNDSGAAPTVDGEITFDDASIGSATTMFIHHKDKNGTTVRYYTRASLKKGSRIVIRNTDDLSKWYMLDIESNHTNHGTYDDWAISPVSTGLAPLTAYGSAVVIEFRGIAEAPDDDVFYARRNTVWEPVPTITVSSTEPSSPSVGDIWIDTT
jgi:hypothetical protein